MVRLSALVTFAMIIAAADPVFGGQSPGSTSGGTGTASPGSSTTQVSPNRGNGSSGPTVPTTLDAGTPTMGNGTSAGATTGNEGSVGTIPNGSPDPNAPPSAGTKPGGTPPN